MDRLPERLRGGAAERRRKQDQTRLREAFRSGIAKASRVAALLSTPLPGQAPAPDASARRLAAAAAAA